MDKALYIAMTGAKHNMLAQTNHANNMANINTTGFRADFAQARSMPIYNGEGQPTRAYALTESPGTDFQHGPMINTDNELRSEEHTSELQSRPHLVCRLLLEKKKKKTNKPRKL